MSDTKTTRWYMAEVTSAARPLSCGFHVGGYAYVSKAYDGHVSVFNGGYATRCITQEEARKCLKLGRRLSAKESAKIDNDYSFAANY